YKQVLWCRNRWGMAPLPLSLCSESYPLSLSTSHSWSVKVNVQHVLETHGDTSEDCGGKAQVHQGDDPVTTVCFSRGTLKYLLLSFLCFEENSFRTVNTSFYCIRSLHNE